MSRKERKNKKKAATNVDPESGMEAISGHYHEHRSRKGQRGSTQRGLFHRRYKAAKEQLDPRNKSVKKRLPDWVPFAKRNRNARRDSLRKPVRGES